MATRQVKNAKDIDSNELIYFKGHAKATYMSDGTTVEDAINYIKDSSENSVDTSNLATKDELAQKQDIISDIEEIRTNAANYKGTVTGVEINGTTNNPSSGVVNLGYVNKQLSTSTSSSMTLSPNIYYRNTSTSLSTLTITLGSVSNSTIINEYFVEFTTSSSGTTVSLPSGIKWMNGVTPTFEASTTYQISIVNNLGTWVKFK